MVPMPVFTYVSRNCVRMRLIPSLGTSTSTSTRLKSRDRTTASVVEDEGQFCFAKRLVVEEEAATESVLT